MMFPARSLADNLCVRPTQAPEVYCECNPCQARRGRRTTSLSDGDVIRNAKRQRHDLSRCALHHFAVRIENQVLLEIAANSGITPCRRDGEFVSFSRLDVDIEIHGQRRRIERRPKVR